MSKDTKTPAEPRGTIFTIREIHIRATLRMLIALKEQLTQKWKSPSLSAQVSFVVQQTFLELQNKAALQCFSSTTEVDGKPNSPETPQDPK